MNPQALNINNEDKSGGITGGKVIFSDAFQINQQCYQQGISDEAPPSHSRQVASYGVNLNKAFETILS
ncbi:hypothetical protein CEXT_260481 [Caerostris extrusa]|uniref:Uncharacterized protein n=1 Tax=Caerostris extrusa TaxID=172846 RepID=A0AAV4UFE9_CAEEX|nr:hypothetical protein CEXT_260481 [Caerostris extrusa]